MPKVSIITPIYCGISAKVNWLDEMIQSVQSQTLIDWEIILINDKSPLSLDPVKMKYATDGRLRWFENAQNFGPAMTRNTAVALAESECILPLDSDDMLADNETLEYMYDAWLMDNTKTIYGNVQLYQPKNNIFERSKVYQLAHYSFEGAMNLQFGIMPVTTMHSKEAHYKAGGWKAELKQGREDLEYWIACGKAGFCGHKINYTTLLYRKHEQSRDYKLKFELKQLEVVQQQIKTMHSDIYKGEFPMACCGKSGSRSKSTPDPLVISQQNMSNKEVKYITPLDGYDEKDLEWVAYQGPKTGSAGRILVRGPANLPSEYSILGKGHFFQIHRQHHKTFSDRQRLGFEVNQPDPRKKPESEPVEMAITPEPQVIEVPKPELSTIVRIDAVAAQTKEVAIQHFDEYAEIEQDYIDKVTEKYSLSDLNLSAAITKKLKHGHWTAEDLAKTTPEELSKIPGIATKRANIIINRAKELINK